jgi:hypothetical protein
VGDESLIAAGQFRRFAAGFVQLIISGLQDFKHFLKDGLGGADDAFEWLIRYFIDAFHHSLLLKKGGKDCNIKKS